MKSIFIIVVLAQLLNGRYIEDQDTLEVEEMDSRQLDIVKKEKLYPLKNLLDPISNLFTKFLELFHNEQSDNEETRNKRSVEINARENLESKNIYKSTMESFK